MRYLTVIIAFLCLCGCGTTHTRTSLKNAQVLLEHQVKTAQNLAASEEMMAAGPKVRNFVEEMNAIGQVAQEAIRPADVTLTNQSKLLPWSKAEQVQPDISLEGLNNDFKGEIAKTKFRAQMAQTEANNGWLATIVRNMGDQSWSVWLFGIASTFLTGGSGLLIVNKIRTRIKALAEESMINKEVAKNAIHYGKDMEQIALGEETNIQEIQKMIEQRRTVSMLDQHKKVLLIQ